MGAVMLSLMIFAIFVGFPIAFAIAPGDIGPTFARLGVPYKFAYAIDLTFRFVPSLAADMATTMDAQRVRGYEWDRVRGGPIGRRQPHRVATDERDASRLARGGCWFGGR